MGGGRLSPTATTLKAKASVEEQLYQDGGRSYVLASGPNHGPVQGYIRGLSYLVLYLYETMLDDGGPGLRH